jgi:hypothetical protein
LALIYYLLLQDRIIEARTLYSPAEDQLRQCYELQCAYLDCYLDMYLGSTTQYSTAKSISQKYKDYPVIAWQKLFKDVY